MQSYLAKWPTICLLYGISCALPCAALAESTVYVGDQFEITLRTGKGKEYEIRRMIPSGSQLTLLEQDNKAGYALVRTSSGAEGWVLQRYLVTDAPPREQLAQAKQQLASIQAELPELKRQVSDALQDKLKAEKERDQLSEKNLKLSRELAEIRRVSAHAVQIAEENSVLKTRSAESQRTLQLLAQENETLKDSSQRDWFLTGALVVVASMLFGIMLTRIQWRRKSSWGGL